MTDGELAAHLADVAGRLLLEVRASGVFSAKALGKAGDQTANQFLIHAIREQRPDDGLLSEEEKDNFERLAHKRVWIIDPVDGTREYGEARTDWAVHIALAVDGDHVPVRHFGVVLSMPEWDSLSGRLIQANTDFIIKPHVRFQGQVGEQATMFFLDPSGNALEFKAFKDMNLLFAR